MCKLWGSKFRPSHWLGTSLIQQLVALAQAVIPAWSAAGMILGFSFHQFSEIGGVFTSLQVDYLTILAVKKCSLFLNILTIQFNTPCAKISGPLTDKLVYKKSELILMGRARAYSSSCSQGVLACLKLFPSISSQFTVLQPKITKKSLKPLFLGFKVNQCYQCWQA